MIGTLVVAVAVAAVVVAGLILWLRTRRVVTTPAERAVHSALHTASLAAVPLRGGLTAESAGAAAPHLRVLTGAEGLGVADAEGVLLAWDGAHADLAETFAEAVRRALAGGRAVLVKGGGEGDQAARVVVVAFGDSITDGFVGATPLAVPADRAVADTNGRYPDVLQRRLDAANIPVSVVNAGIGSNRVLTSGEPLLLGPSGLARFERDALNRAGVGGVLVQEGINDLGLPPHADAPAMIAGYEQLIEAAHRHGKKIWLGTLLPASDAIVDGTLLVPGSEATRQQINAWIRTQTLADGVVDFDAAVRDPGNPAVLRDAYSGPDRLHPSLAGYRAMAETIDLTMLAAAESPSC
ncbi:GDSL-type esterase/lipase family protein [Nocardia sp. N2S4-5]|uniref:GDSL-type esterase/lipase family protein n=1 Tax=Nocardia sp. N2S4-5 TaxID=3351565 RepID=UPI0037D43C24